MNFSGLGLAILGAFLIIAGVTLVLVVAIASLAKSDGVKARGEE